MNILIGVCGSISAYKAIDIARGLVKQGHKVRVVLTRGALEFVRPQVFRYLGIEEVYTPEDDFNYPQSQNDTGNVLHIELAKWCNRFVVAPLSANSLSRLALGQANDLLSCIFLALPQSTPIILYPAMNTLMYQHPFVQENIDLVQKIKTLPQVFVYPPSTGELACGDEGEGKLPDVHEIIETVAHISPAPNPDRKRVLITAGATIAPLDPVRYLTNASSGITGFYIARECLAQGHHVTVVAGKHATKQLDYLVKLPNFSLTRVTTTSEMAIFVQKEMKDHDIYISTAAISDFEFDIKDQKLKKDELNNSLSIKKATDILEGVMSERKNHQKIIGFAAETNLSYEILSKKWQRKPVDLLIGTQVDNGLIPSKSLQGFAVEEAQYSFMEKGNISFEGRMSKKKLAQEIISRF